MIDQDKMRALAAKLRDYSRGSTDADMDEAADAIDLLLAEVEAMQTCKLCRSTGPDVPCAYPTEINRQLGRAIIKMAAEKDKLRADLDAAEADKRELFALLPSVYYMDPPDGGDVSLIEQLRRMAKDAERYRLLRRGQRWSVVNWIGETLRAEQLDATIDGALSAFGSSAPASE